MEWIKQMSLKKSLAIIIITFVFLGLIIYTLTILAINHLFLFPTDTCICEFRLLQLILPFSIAVSMPILAALIFYQIKLKTPLSQLNMGAKRMKDNDLDFELKFSSQDELGQLCESFEPMRVELRKSNQALWQQMEERKRLNAAFAHDLRNPVTVLKGSATLLEKGLQQGNLTLESAGESISLIAQYTERIEGYIGAMTSAQKLDELIISPQVVDWSLLAKELKNSLSILSVAVGKKIQFCYNSESREIWVDKYLVHNVAENLISNGLRYSKHEVMVEMTCDDEKVVLCVRDDGAGFSSAILSKGVAPFLRDDPSRHGENFGMGLYICQLLCKKHSGTLTLANDAGGAKVTATFKINS